jgi:hypothetical protein
MPPQHLKWLPWTSEAEWTTLAGKVADSADIEAEVDLAANRIYWRDAGRAPAVGGHSPMNETDFEGTLVLEQLARVGKVDEFLDAVDSDDERRVAGLLRRAGVDTGTITIVLKKMRQADGKH